MARRHLRLCLALLPAATTVVVAASSAAAATGRSLAGATYYNHGHRRRLTTAFSGTSRRFSSTAGADSTDRKGANRGAQPLRSTVRDTRETLQALATAAPSLLTAVVAVASDVDGTLTAPDKTVTSRTKDAIKAVMDAGLLFFPATGKTRAGMYKILGEEMGTRLRANNSPGVFIQGLVVYAGSGDEVLFERLLDADVVAQVVSFCEEKGVSLIAYSGDRIVCSTKDAQTDKIAEYMEPMPEAVGPLPEAMAAGLKIHKLILMDTTDAIDRVRPDIERLVGAAATFTQALPDMLEVLPPGASKGNGVEILLNHLGIDPLQLMALGDAENDVDMLRTAGVGVCVGNASPPARAAAGFEAPTNAEDGAAVAMEQLLSSRMALE